MNLRKGFFRLTLVLSFACGILTLIFSDDIFRNTSLMDRSRNILVTIPLPSYWQNETLQRKLNSIDELLIRWSELEKKKFEEEKKKSEEEYEARKERTKKEEFVKPSDLFPIEPHTSCYYSELTSREQQNVERRLREQIISDEKELPKDRERENYYIFSGPDWRELSFPIFIEFTIGFFPVWIIYGFIRWVVIGFIVGGFGGKSVKGGESD